jgi:hypothetical protein
MMFIKMLFIIGSLRSRLPIHPLEDGVSKTIVQVVYAI